MKKKIILGSANFDQKYGLKKNSIKKKEIKKLLLHSYKNNIVTIDTSPVYKNSEKIIGNLNKKRFKIISKIPKIPKKIKKKKIKEWINKKVAISLKNLKIKKFDCLLLHNANILLGKNGDEIYKIIKELKKKKISSKIGISIYDFKILTKILKKFKFDLIQAPFNILDQRLVKTGWLKKLKKRKIEVHARSIFLQGILLLKKKQLPRKLHSLNESWYIWEKWLKQNKFNPLQVCFSFVANQNQLDGIVIGCNSKNQLDQTLKIKHLKKILLPNFNIKNKKLIDPRNWIDY